MNVIYEVQGNPELGMPFSAALRSILRQAPNVIMIGEIRDLETASISTNASLTGHLVFSTLHTNDAPSAIARLIDIGVQPFLVASWLRAIVAQRLVRRICSNCREPTELTESEMRALRIERGQLRDAQVMQGEGCVQCRSTGYKGRMGIFEIFVLDDEFIDETGLYHTIAEALGTEYVDLSDKEIPPVILKLIPSGLARLHRALPIGLSGNTLRVALVDPLDLRAAEDLRFALGKDVDVVVAPTEQIDNRIKEHYGADTTSMEDVLKQLGKAGDMLQIRADETAPSLETEPTPTPTLPFLDLILYQAIQDRASDIHFEPFENEFKIRYRVDVALYEMSPPPRHLALPVISRVKVLAKLNLAERRTPHDGPIQIHIADRHIGLR